MSPLHTIFKGYNWNVKYNLSEFETTTHLYSSCCTKSVSCVLYSKGAREPIRLLSSMKYQTWPLTSNHLFRITNGWNKKLTSYSLLNEGHIGRNHTLFLFSSCQHWYCIWVGEKEPGVQGSLLTKLNDNCTSLSFSYFKKREAVSM